MEELMYSHEKAVHYWKNDRLFSPTAVFKTDTISRNAYFSKSESTFFARHVLIIQNIQISKLRISDVIFFPKADGLGM